MTALDPEVLALQEHLAGRYSVESELGRGGMGLVLLARDVALDRLVAIKMLPDTLAANPDYRRRFLREARTAAGLSHPNIVPIHLVEEHDRQVFFVMGFVDGESLRERVDRSGPVSPRLAMKLMQDVAYALAYAHQRGVVHRDIKPDNIMIEQGTNRALVTDFGIALGRHETDRGSGEVIGTARYMSPEQAVGEAVDARSDLYALGATFYFALTGRAAFDGAHVQAILASQVTQQAPSVTSTRPEVPERFSAAIDRCLAKDPEERWQSGDELATVLGEVRGRDLRAPPLVRSFVRNAQITTMAVLAVLLAGSGVVATTDGNVSFDGGPGLIGIVLITQLVLTARRLLREGYRFNDIREAMLTEARIQEEETEVLPVYRWVKWLNTQWQRLWTGWFGRWFFRVAAIRLKTPKRQALPSVDATEMVLGRSTMAVFDALPDAARRGARDVPDVVDGLEARAERLRARGDTGEDLNHTVAALENLRLVMLKVQAGLASAQDLTGVLEEAKAIGEVVDRRLDAAEELDRDLPS
jgi:serine/threonine-protein kinase